MYVMRKLKLTEIERNLGQTMGLQGKVWFFSSLSPSVTSVLDGYRIIWQSLKSGKRYVSLKVNETIKKHLGICHCQGIH